jgi:7,8-dihydropterin-6-yl-methyl-4-(beta-D-ribofuranosyl)aminobenzene 5'-phosphate synthase
MKFFRGLLILSSLLCSLTFTERGFANDRVTILYDAFGDNPKLTRDWGFSALVEHDGKRILFDTGNNADTFAHNTRALGIDLNKLDCVVISHRHTDHSTGLQYVLSVNPKVTVYAPKEGATQFGGDLPRTFFRPISELPTKMRYFGGDYPQGIPSGRLYNGGNFVLIDALTEILPDILVVPTISRNPGTLELHELTLAIKGPSGLTLVDGCSHAGVEEILRAASAIDTRFHVLFGGLHLVTTPEDEIARLVENLKEKWKIEKIAPGHCTGEPAFFRLQKAFASNYIYAGLGAQIEVP